MDYSMLKLDNQLCFPLYACAKEVIKKYKPHLDKIDLTYTQYITMMVLWEHQTLNVKTIGQYLHLDSGTLTPVLKKLEARGYLTRARSAEDERNLIVVLTEKGAQLREQAKDVPAQVGGCIPLEPDEAAILYKLLYKILDSDK